MADVTSVINGAVDKGVNTSLSLDITLRVERGVEGKWIVLSSDIKEVGPVTVKPTRENNTYTFKSMLIKGSGPRPQVAWKPKPKAQSITS